MGTTPWTVGDVIPVRHQWRDRVWFAHPAIVVEDSLDRLVLFEPVGSIRQWSWFDIETGEIRPPTPSERHTTDALIILESDVAHAISLFWSGGGGPFLCWYVDMQAPFRRAGGGIVTWDHTLDIVVGPSFDWRWKDSVQLEKGVAWGWMTADETRLICEEGKRVVRAIEQRAAPFDGGWPQWQADPSWATPSLPADWASVF